MYSRSRTKFTNVFWRVRVSVTASKRLFILWRAAVGSDVLTKYRACAQPLNNSPLSADSQTLINIYYTHISISKQRLFCSIPRSIRIITVYACTKSWNINNVEANRFHSTISIIWSLFVSSTLLRRVNHMPHRCGIMRYDYGVITVTVETLSFAFGCQRADALDGTASEPERYCPK